MRLDQNRDGVFNGEPRSEGTHLPVLLTYTALLKQNQTVQPVEQLYFKNPYRAPMWVDEFHFTIRQQGEEIDDFVPYELMAMRMKLNGQYIVDDFVPLCLVGPHTDSAESSDQTSGASYGNRRSFLWRLAKPLWVDELDDLVMELTWLSGFTRYITIADIADVVMNVQVALAGRSTVNANRPKERFLPFNVVWNPGMLTAPVDEEFTERSPDSALRNGRDSAVVITRMLGTMTPIIGDPETAEGILAMNSNFLMNLRISHSAGYYMVKDLTPFYELFQNLSRSFEIRFVLQPKEFLTVELQSNTITLVANDGGGEPVPDPTAYLLTGFSLQGYSVEALR